jgi:hypothetical protein
MDDNRYLWAASWAWGLPLIVLNVVIHVAGLALINAPGGVISVTFLERCYEINPMSVNSTNPETGNAAEIRGCDGDAHESR